MYYQGTLEIKSNHEKAFKYFQASAAQLTNNANLNTNKNAASAQAAAALGQMYWKGEGVRKDEKAALRWFHKAAENGDGVGLSYLGYMYQHGHLVVQVYSKGGC